MELNISSFELFARVEFFRNTLIHRSSNLNSLSDTKVLPRDLVSYMRESYDVLLEPKSNQKVLFNILLKPLNLKHGQRLILEVDQNFGAFPIGLVENPSTGKLLLEECSVVYTPSASIFSYLRRQPPTPTFTADYAGFSYNSDRNSYVDTIIDDASNCFDGSAAVFHQVTERELYAASGSLKNYRYLHFACHSTLSDDGVCLCLKPDEEDGFLTATDVAEKLSNQSDLTALTSCTTAPYLEDYFFLHLIEGGALLRVDCICNLGETFSDIMGSFFSAGSRSILATQWDIPDSSISAEFMSHFFCLLDDGYGADRALQLTQNQFKQYDVQYWGGYILVGQ